MVLGVNRSGYGGASGADQKQAIPSRVGPALRADRYEGEGEPYDSARSLRGTCKLAVSNRTQGDTLGPGFDPGAGRVMSPPQAAVTVARRQRRWGHGPGAADAAPVTRPGRRRRRSRCRRRGASVNQRGRYPWRREPAGGGFHHPILRPRGRGERVSTHIDRHPPHTRAGPDGYIWTGRDTESTKDY